MTRLREPHVVVVGDVVLDRDVDGRTERLAPDAPVPVVDVTATRESPGGAGLTALLLAASGAQVTLVAPLADDAGGRTLAWALAAHLTVVELGHEGPTRTKVRVRSSGQSLVRVDDGGPGTPCDVAADRVRAVLAGADVVLVSDYGAGVTRDPVLRAALTDAALRLPVVWDPHPRGGPPVAGARVVTPNLAEGAAALAADGRAPAGLPPDAVAQRLRALWDADAVALTAGALGAFVAAGDAPLYVPAPAVAGDPCGAGDRFAATVALATARGDDVGSAVQAAVADASAWVAAGGAEGFRVRDALARRAADAAPSGAATVGGPDETPRRPDLRVVDSREADLERLGTQLRAGGRTLVATGGCFDIVHAGHVATLQAARRLGDALVVLLNGDDSVRRLKGPGRPLVPAPDRAQVLEAFECVDAVVVFHEDDPSAALRLLRPDVWAKGGDYAAADLPERAVVAEHGGRVVLLPFLGGRSTTRIIERSAAGGALPA